MADKFSYRGDYRASKGPYEGSQWSQAYRDSQSKKIYGKTNSGSDVDIGEIVVGVGAVVAAGVGLLIAALSGSGKK